MKLKVSLLLLLVLTATVSTPPRHQPLGSPKESLRVVGWRYTPRAGWYPSKTWESRNVRREVVFVCSDCGGFSGVVVWHHEPSRTWENIKNTIEITFLASDLVEMTLGGEVNVLVFLLNHIAQEAAKEAFYGYVEGNLLNRDGTADIFLVQGRLNGVQVVAAWFLKDGAQVASVDPLLVPGIDRLPLQYRYIRDEELSRKISQKALAVPFWNFKAVRVEPAEKYAYVGEAIRVKATIQIDACTLPPNTAVRLYVGEDPYRGLVAVASIPPEKLVPGTVTLTLTGVIRERAGLGNGKTLTMEVNFGRKVPELKFDDNMASDTIGVGDRRPNMPPVVKALTQLAVVKVGEEVDLSEYVLAFDPDQKPFRRIKLWWRPANAPEKICDTSKLDEGKVFFRQEGVCTFFAYATDGDKTGSARISVEARVSGVWARLLCNGRPCPPDGLRLSVNEKVEFRVDAEDLDGRTVSLDWDFGDGTVKLGSKTRSFVYSYDRVGEYRVKIVVRNDLYDPDNAKTYVVLLATVIVSSIGGGVRPYAILCPQAPRGRMMWCPPNGSDPGIKYPVDVAYGNLGETPSQVLGDPVNFTLKLYEVKGGEAELIGEKAIGYLGPRSGGIATFYWIPRGFGFYELRAVLVGTGHSGEERYKIVDSVGVAVGEIPAIKGLSVSPNFPRIGGAVKLRAYPESGRKISRYEWFSPQLLGGRAVTREPFIDISAGRIVFPGTYTYRVRACDELGYCSQWAEGSVTFVSDLPLLRVEIRSVHLVDARSMEEVRKLAFKRESPRSYKLISPLYPGEYILVKGVLENLGGGADDVSLNAWIEDRYGNRPSGWVQREIIGEIVGSSSGVLKMNFGSMDSGSTAEFQLLLRTGRTKGTRYLVFRTDSSPKDPVRAGFQLEIGNSWPDLEVESVYVYDSGTGKRVDVAEPGQSLAVKAVIRNRGPSSLNPSIYRSPLGNDKVSLLVRIYAKKTQGVQVWWLLGEKTVSLQDGLPANGSVHVEFSLNKLDEGDWLIGIEVDPLTGYIDSYPGNNKASTHIRIGRKPDITVSGIRLAPGCYTNRTREVTVEATLSNNGYSPVQGLFNATLYVGGKAVAAREVEQLRPGETITERWIFKPDFKGKTLSIVVAADEEGRVEEMYEWNNWNGTWLSECGIAKGIVEPSRMPAAETEPFNKTVFELPDLTVRILRLISLDPPEELYRCHYLIQLEVSNIGHADAGRFFLEIRDSYSGFQEELYRSELPGIRMGEKMLLSIKVTLPNPCPHYVSHLLKITVDPDDIVAEESEDNNYAKVFIP